MKGSGAVRDVFHSSRNPFLPPPPNHLPWNFKANSQGIGVTVRRKWRLGGWEEGVWWWWIPAWIENGANGANGSAALHTSKRLSSSSVSYSTWKGNHPEKKNITSFINRLTDFTYFFVSSTCSHVFNLKCNWLIIKDQQDGPKWW